MHQYYNPSVFTTIFELQYMINTFSSENKTQCKFIKQLINTCCPLVVQYEAYYQIDVYYLDRFSLRNSTSINKVAVMER